jgi:hypothetical protein
MKSQGPSKIPLNGSIQNSQLQIKKDIWGDPVNAGTQMLLATGPKKWEADSGGDDDEYIITDLKRAVL